jgi:hypothetical protein
LGTSSGCVWKWGITYPSSGNSSDIMWTMMIYHWSQGYRIFI